MVNFYICNALGEHSTTTWTRRGGEGSAKVHACPPREGEGQGSLECSGGPKFEKKSAILESISYHCALDLKTKAYISSIMGDKRDWST